MKRSLLILFCTLTLVFALRNAPQFTEVYYSNMIFPVISGTLQSISSVLPFPLFIPVLVILVFTLIKAVIAIKSTGFRPLIVWLNFIVLGFYLSWGFNYSRTDIRVRLSLGSDTLQDNTIAQLMREATDEVNKTAVRLGELTPRTIDNVYIKDTIPELVKAVMSDMGYILPKQVLVREFIPQGMLLRLATAGFYFPYTAECNIDAGLHPIQKAFVAAHECVHGFGIGDEGTCNFIAYLACMRSANILVKYSAQLAYWRTLKSLKVNHALDKRELLNDIALHDLQAIIDTMNKYPDVFPEVRDFIYENFLKMQGIEEGEANYDRFVDLLYFYQQKNSGNQ